MKRRELIKELVRLYNSIPEGASSYHICDMLLARAERLGMYPPKVQTQCEDPKLQSWIENSETPHLVVLGWDDEDESLWES